MAIHPEKTCILHFGHNNPRYEYEMNGTKITTVTSARDLGVIVDDKCSPSEHVAAVTKKANGILAQLRRTMVCRNQEVITKLFKVFV